MILIWGTYAYRHPVAPTCCVACGAAASTCPIERVSHFMFVPLFPRRFDWVSKCPRCKHSERGARAREGEPVRAMSGRIIASWVLVVGAIISLVVGTHVAARGSAAHVSAAEVGDEWTIRPSRWPELYGELEFGRARVEEVDGDKIRAAACEETSDMEDAVERRCHSYSLPIEPRTRDELAHLYEEGAIVSVSSADDPMDPFEVLSGGLVIAAIVAGLFTRRSARRSFRDEPLAQARVV